MNAILAESASSADHEMFFAIGIVATALIGIANLAYSVWNNQRSSYVTSVTATRLKWIGEVRDHLSTFCASIQELVDFPPTDPKELQKLQARIVQERALLRLQLAPKMATLDNDFQDRINSLYVMIGTGKSVDIDSELDQLVSFGQEFLWNEWMKVKRETIDGDPYSQSS